MKPDPYLRWWYALALLLGVVAVGLTVQTATGTPRALAQLARRHGDLLQLHGLAERHAGTRRAVQTFEAAPAGVTDLVAWCAGSWPALKPEITEREVRPLQPGWAVRRVDVRLADATLAEVGQLMAGVEALRPPWRVVDLQLEAAGGEPGRGRAGLVLETVFRPETGKKP